eukprot:INCI1769.1.p1 GENE.INCI1769.1~~INCI1769.1.p1  ORF type:complete len:329 (+),score=39.70 INCI1769.1:295-1281(+)
MDPSAANAFEFAGGGDLVGGGESGSVHLSSIQSGDSAGGGAIGSTSWSSAAVLAGVTWLAGMIANVFFLIGPVLMFVPQYRSIRATGSAKSFSTTVCFVLLTAHLMRCFFWVGKRFETVQLLQSIIVVGSQLVLLHVCVRCNYNERQLKSSRSTTGGAVEMTAVDISSPVTPRSPAPRTQTTVFNDLAAHKFWSWNFFSSYVLFLFGYVLVLLGLTVMFLDSSLYFEVIGCIGLCTEATLAMPQALRNHRRKSTDGLSLFLVFNWIFGDSVRLCIYYLRHLPVRVRLGSVLSFERSKLRFGLTQSFISSVLYQLHCRRNFLRLPQCRF